MPLDDSRPVLIVGLGAMGREIALQCARFGLATVLYDAAPEAYDRCRAEHDRMLAEWEKSGVTEASSIDGIRSRMRYERTPEAAAKGIGLLIESVPEDVPLKRRVLAEFDRLAPAEAIFVTNTSYLTPSMLLSAFGHERGERFAAFHFHEPVWFANVVDVMPHPGTSRETVETLLELASRIDQHPILCRAERPGYVGNAMIDAVLGAAMMRVIDGVAPFDDVDRAWMGMMKTPIGPFGILDRIGLDTVHGIMKSWHESTPDPLMPTKMAFLRSYIDLGRLGLKSGRGFYEYPSPEFEKPEFLRKPVDGDVIAEEVWRTPPVRPWPTLADYALKVAGPVDFVIDAAINGGIAWYFLRDAERVPLVGLPSAAVFWAPMVFCVLLLGTYIGHINGMAARRKGLGAGLPPAAPGWRRIAWRRALERALIGLAGVAVLTGGVWLVEPSLELSGRVVILVDAIAAGILGYVAQASGVLGARRLEG